MAKPSTNAALKRGEELLHQWQTADQLDALGEAWGRDPDADFAIVARLGQRGNAEAAALLVELEARAPSKALRKEIRRTLFRLEQKGVPVPKPAPPQEPVRPLGPTPVEGYTSPVDGAGDQILWLLRPQPGGLLQLFAVINDPAGMREVELQAVTRKVVRSMREDLRRRHEIEMTEIDAAYCDQRMSEAYAWATSRGATVRGDYLGFRAQIFREPPRPVTHPILSVLDPAAVRADATVLAESAELLEEKEFRTWFLSTERVQPHLDQLQMVFDSPLVLNEQQKEERAREVVGNAVATEFGGENRGSYVRRLLDTAWIFHATRRPLAARRALATALALEHGNEGGKGIPFCETLVRMSVATHFRMTAEKKAEESKTSLIMTPQEARARAERDR